MAGQDNRDDMLMNWPERVWIYSPIRPLFLRCHVQTWRRLAGPFSGGIGLEIGCGLGPGARILTRKMGFERLVAFDIEESLVRHAVGITRDLQDRIHLFVGDAQELPFPDGSFDAAVNFGIIHHVLDWRRCLAEISRVLRPEGLFFFEEIYPPLYANFLLRRMLRHPREDRFDGYQFLTELSRNGLSLVDGTDTASRYAIVGAARKEGPVT